MKKTSWSVFLQDLKHLVYKSYLQISINLGEKQTPKVNGHARTKPIVYVIQSED